MNKIELYRANELGYKHKNLIFWVAMINSMASPLKVTDKVLDFGCGSGMFLQLLYDFYNYSLGIGLDIDYDSIDKAQTRLKACSKNYPINYFCASLDVLVTEKKMCSYFDIVFIQEVLWMNNDLLDIAKKLYKVMKNGAVCYCSLGCHEDNPIWEFRRKKMIKENMPFYNYSIDEIADIFTKAGFSVGLRRLPIDGFFMFHPETTIHNSGSFFDLVSSSYENKLLFYFSKSEPVSPSTNIQD